MSPRTRTFLFTAMALAGILTAALLWSRSFSTAAIDFKVPRAEAERTLRAQAKALTGMLDGCMSAVSFGEDTDTKNFIEREHGVSELERLTRRGMNIWHWTARWFQPEQEEEFSASIDPAGRFVGYSHTIPEGQAAPSPGQPAARAIAEDFLREHVPHHPLEKLRFVSGSEEKRPNRTDCTFTWERGDLRVGDASYRLNVEVQGDRIGSFNEALRVPEAWGRAFARQRESNALFQSLAQYAAAPLIAGMAVLFFIYAGRHRIRWRDALPVRWLWLAALVAIAAALSTIPSIAANYVTTENWGSFVFRNVSVAVFEALGTVAGFWLLAVVADPLYREMLPGRLSFRAAMGRGALRQPETLRALGAGVAFACFALGYVAAFYVVAQRFGAWSPVQIDYVNTLDRWLPWISGMQVGISAAWIEEVVFRVIAILLCWKLLRVRWLAVVLAAATWGFLHSAYPQSPGYLRGTELTLVGILWGSIFLRYGLVATLTTHYLYDCWLSNLTVARSSDWVNVAGALAVSMWPVALWIRAWWLQRGGAAIHALEAAEEESVPPPAPAEIVLRHEWNFAPAALSPKRRFVYAATGVALIAAAHLTPLPQDAWGRLGRLELTRSQILERAETALRERGHEPAACRAVVTLSGATLPVQYLIEHGSLDEVAALYDTGYRDVNWHVRFFQFGQKEEFLITLDKQGMPRVWTHTVPREAPGASLDRAAALALARDDLVRFHSFRPADEKLIAENLTQQEHRRDYTFTFQRENWRWGESEYRTTIRVQGDEPGAVSSYVKIPDAWSREHQKAGWRQALLSEGSTWLSVGAAALFGVVLVLLIRRNLMPWKVSFLIAIVPTAFAVAAFLNELPSFFSVYSTVTPPGYFIAKKLGGWAFGVGFGYLAQAVRVAITLGVVRWAFGWTLRDLHLPPKASPERRRWFRNLIAIVLLSIGIMEAEVLLANLYGGYVLPSWVAAYSIPDVSSAVPFLESLIAALQKGWNNVLRVALLFSIFVLLHRRWPRAMWALLFALPVLSALEQETWPEFIYEVLRGELRWLVLLLLAWRIWRFDVWVIAAVYLTKDLLGSIVMFLEKGGPHYSWQAAPLLLAMALPLVFACGFRRHRAPAGNGGFPAAQRPGD